MNYDKGKKYLSYNKGRNTSEMIRKIVNSIYIKFHEKRDKTGLNQGKYILYAFLAAALYGISSPISKRLLYKLEPAQIAAFLYLGAGFGIMLLNLINGLQKRKIEEQNVTKKDLLFVIGMVVLDIGAPILLMFGLKSTTSANASLLNNFEIVATSLIALFLFGEAINKRMWVAITLITISSIILTVNDYSGLTFSGGSFLVLGACICWGLENNCTRMLSLKNPLQIVVIKGFGSGLGSLILSLFLKEKIKNIEFIFLAMFLGFIAYGLSIYYYIMAQRGLGAAKTSAFYAVSPFIGVLLSWLVFQEKLTAYFLSALIIMILGAYYAATENHVHMHTHVPVTHEHKHNHMDGHHNHTHSYEVIGEHTHVHTHEAVIHSHPHSPDLHHRHRHIH